MTESIENELTPEEKLLKVIRDGDAEEVALEPDVATVATIVDEVAKETKPDLKLVKKDAKSKGDVATEALAASIVPSSDTIGAEPAVVDKTARRSVVNIGFVNKILAIIVIVMVGLAVYEIWKNIKRSAYKTDSTDNVLVATLVDQAPEDELPPLGEVLTKFAESEFVGKPDKVEVKTVDPKKPEPTPIETYVKENLNLIGLSGDEAIISDGKTGKMHFLKLGDTMIINDVEVKVSEVSSEYVELSDGDKKVRIK